MSVGTKVAVLGASGVLGQYLRLTVPRDVEAVYTRRTRDGWHVPADFTTTESVREFLDAQRPTVVINLAGENRVDAVEREPETCRWVNECLPFVVAQWCGARGAHLLHVSTQAVFDGTGPPYGPHSRTAAVNEYGRQRLAAEKRLYASPVSCWTIIRATFLLGVRPMPYVGRGNPLEQFFAEDAQRQVDDRWFSPCFASDAAHTLWALVWTLPAREILHMGLPVRTTRYELAVQARAALGQAAEIVPVRHDEFAGLAPRAVDTTFADQEKSVQLDWRFAQCASEWRSRADPWSREDRARELALFLGTGMQQANAMLAFGFGWYHQRVAESWHRANPKTDAEILSWYLETDAYVWELSAYHLDAGFNYLGMCTGIAEKLVAEGTRQVLCLGDGIGDATLILRRHGLRALYNDLSGSLTASFGVFRLWRHFASRADLVLSTRGWEPPTLPVVDAVVALDFFEHLVNVEEWARAVAASLGPGGLLMAQNAFAVGDEEHGGSIPMHLSRNNRYEKEWHPLIESLGFRREGDWWRKT